MLDELADQSARDRFLVLRSFPTMSEVDDEGLALIAAHARLRRFPKGAVVQDAADPGGAVWVVRSGALSSSQRGAPPVRVERPFGVGFRHVIGDVGWSPNVLAEEDCELLEIPASRILESMEQNSSIVRNSLRALAGYLLELRHNLPIDPDRADPEPPLGEYRDRPSTLVERVIELSENSPIFSTLDAGALVDLASFMIERRYQPGEALWEEGDRSDSAYRIVYGCVCCSAGGQSVLVGADYTLGGLDQLVERPRAYRAVAETEVIGFQNDGEKFSGMLEMHPKSAILLAGTLARASLDAEIRLRGQDAAEAA